MTSSREKTRKEILASFLREVWSGGRIEACDTYLAKNYVIHHDPGDSWDGKNLTIAEFKERVRLSRAPFADHQFHVQEMFADGSAVVATWLWSATHTGDLPDYPATGQPLTMSGATVYYFDDRNRIFGHWQVADRVGVFRQLRRDHASGCASGKPAA